MESPPVCRVSEESLNARSEPCRRGAAPVAGLAGVEALDFHQEICAAEFPVEV